MKTVVLVDDHSLIRSGLSQALIGTDYQVIGEAASKSEALAVLNNKAPDICILDLNLGDGNGLDVITALNKAAKIIKFVILTMDDDEDNLNLAKESGASAYVLKSSPVSELLEVLSILEKSTKQFQVIGEINRTTKQKDYRLTNRELDVLNLLGEGLTATTMGRKLFLSETTVKTHLAAIYRKLGAAN
ncbi:MAG: response regulator, partial [Actinobacteria bacterium]|nr:response regulator [Actinomycetota bacterium]